jgi:hypothetical protein
MTHLRRFGLHAGFETTKPLFCQSLRLRTLLVCGWKSWYEPLTAITIGLRRIFDLLAALAGLVLSA